MLVCLSMEESRSRLKLPLRNRIFAEDRLIAGERVKYINIEKRREKVNWGKVRKLCRESEGVVLCQNKALIPIESGLRVFESRELRVRRCVNTGIEIARVMKNSPKCFSIGIYDPEAQIADAVYFIVKNIASVVAVSKRREVYFAERDRILEETGAVFNISSKVQALENCHLIIAPVEIKEVLPCRKSSVILTVATPKENQPSLVYYSYKTEEDARESELPKGISPEYFAEALYTLCGRFYLGSEVPVAIRGAGEEKSLHNMAKYLTNIAVCT